MLRYPRSCSSLCLPSLTGPTTTPGRLHIITSVKLNQPHIRGFLLATVVSHVNFSNGFPTLAVSTNSSEFCTFFVTKTPHRWTKSSASSRSSSATVAAAPAAPSSLPPTARTSTTHPPPRRHPTPQMLARKRICENSFVKC